MPDELEERLKSHARAFDSLLSLIPAKLYYGEDVSDQWKRKKQTPEQKKAARIAKLDPDNWKSAKDVLDARAAVAMKRKRENDEDDSVVDAGPSEKPKAAQDLEAKKTKKRKVDAKDFMGAVQSRAANKKESQEERKQRKAAQKATQKEKKQAQKAKAREQKDKAQAKEKERKASRPSKYRKSREEEKAASNEEEIDADEMAEAIAIDKTIATNLVEQLDDQSTTPSSQDEGSPILSPHINSGTSSISSIQPPPLPGPIAKPEADTKQGQTVIPNGNPQTPNERLEARLAQLRAERKADGAEGRPARNRQELLDQRRRKEEERKAAKKKQWRKEKEEEARKEDAEIARRFSPGGSGSLLASPRSPMVESTNSFSFGRVAFGDGTQADTSLSNLLEPRKHKGAADPATALTAVQNKVLRLSSLDESKRRTIEQQDMWLNAKKKAHGERVRDDISLLKKALKRKEGEKRKSEKEWDTRKEGVRFSQQKKQERRENNLQKRNDDKGTKGKKTKVKRPGFEGSFRGRTGGGKGKNKT